MKTHADKTRNKQNKEFVTEQTRNHDALEFLDNRSEAMTQRKLQVIAAQSPQVARATHIQAMADRHSIAQKQERVVRETPIQSGAQQPPIQMAPWNNAPAKFRTDNEDDKVPNSEYLVSAGSYKRYAPINKIRAPGQAYHEGPRSFIYIPPANMSNVARSANRAVPIDANRVRLQNGGNTLTAYRTPANGRVVWDADVNDNGTIGGGRHVGHAVEDLGAALPTLDDADALEKAREQQADVKMGQALGYLKGDMFYLDLYYALEDGQDTMEDGTPITPELAHEAMRRLSNVLENGLESPEIAGIAHALMAHLANQ